MSTRKPGFIGALKDAKEAVAAMAVIGSAGLVVGGWLFQYGLHWLDRRDEARLQPVVDVLMFDFDRRGVLKEYREHRAHLDSNRTLLEQRDASAMPYPLIRARPN